MAIRPYMNSILVILVTYLYSQIAWRRLPHSAVGSRVACVIKSTLLDNWLVITRESVNLMYLVADTYLGAKNENRN